MKYINAQEMKDYVTKIIRNCEKNGEEPSIDLYTILGYIVCLIEEDYSKTEITIKPTDLVQTLKNKPRETPLFSPMYGNLWLAEVDEYNEIITCYTTPLENGATRPTLEQADTVSFFADGTTGDDNGNVTKERQLFINETEIDEELKKTANEYYGNCMMAKTSWWDDGVYHHASPSVETFISGALWMKQQMFGNTNAKL